MMNITGDKATNMGNNNALQTFSFEKPGLGRDSLYSLDPMKVVPTPRITRNHPNTNHFALSIQ